MLALYVSVCVCVGENSAWKVDSKKKAEFEFAQGTERKKQKQKQKFANLQQTVQQTSFWGRSQFFYQLDPVSDVSRPLLLLLPLHKKPLHTEGSKQASALENPRWILLTAATGVFTRVGGQMCSRWNSPVSILSALFSLSLSLSLNSVPAPITAAVTVQSLYGRCTAVATTVQRPNWNRQASRGAQFQRLQAPNYECA